MLEPVQTTVSGTPPAAAPAPAAVAAPAVNQPDAAALQAEIESLKSQTAELTRAAEFWQEKSKTPAAVAAPKKDEEDDTDVLEVLTTKGGKGLDELLAKRGYVRQGDVDAAVNSKATQMVKEQELVARYPDLKRKDTEFFKATALSYGDLVKGGIPQALAMELAAERTELEFMRNGKLKTPTQQTADDKAEKERLRLERVAAQGGDRGGRRAAAEEEDDDAPLTAEQKHIARSMGISEEAYAKRAKAGVAMKGIR